MAESDGAIWRRLDEHGEQIGDLRRLTADLSARDATRQADLKAMSDQINQMRDDIRNQSTKGEVRHSEIVHRLDTLAHARTASDAVREYKGKLWADVVKWAAIAVTILIALGIISGRTPAPIQQQPITRQP